MLLESAPRGVGMDNGRYLLPMWVFVFKPNRGVQVDSFISYYSKLCLGCLSVRFGGVKTYRWVVSTLIDTLYVYIA